MPGEPAPDSYPQMMYERLVLIRELLSPDGSLYIHCDWRANAMLRLICDGSSASSASSARSSQRIGWVSGYKAAAANWIRNHLTPILFYTRDPTRFTFNKEYLPYPPGYRRRDGSPARVRVSPWRTPGTAARWTGSTPSRLRASRARR